MNIEELQQHLAKSKLDGDKIVLNENVHDTIKSIVENYHFDMLKNITAVDNNDNIELIYHLYSTEDQEDLLISTYTKETAETISDIFESAKADENEIYDLFGITFLNNDDLKRLYMPEDWKGHPLRKDYIADDTRLAWNDDNNA